MDDRDDAPTPSDGEPNAEGGPPLPPAPAQPGQPEPWVEVPTPLAAPRRRSTGMLVAIGVLVIIGVVAIVMLTAGGGADLPDELAGQPRITSGPTAGVLEAFEDLEIEGVSMDIGVYGTELAPAYMVMLASGDIGGGAGAMLGTLPTGVFSNADASIDFSKSIQTTIDGVEYVCAPASNTDAAMNVTMCLFSGDELGGVVMSFTPSAPASLLSTTQELVRQIS